MRPCPECGGEGRQVVEPGYPPGATPYEVQCGECDGTGEVEQEESE